MRRPPFPPLLILGLGILAVSAASIMIRFAQREAPSLVIAAWRLTFASLVLVPFALIGRRSEIASLNRFDRLLAVASGLFLAVHFATWITSLAYTSVASSVVLVSTAPLWVALLSPVVLKEPLTGPLVGGLILALFGSILVGLNDVCSVNGVSFFCPSFDDFVRGSAFWGDILALLGAFSAAGYLLIGRKLRARISLISYIFLVYGIAALGLLAVVILLGQPLFGYSKTTFLWMLGLALVPQLLGHTSYNWALAYLSAAYVSITVLGEPIGSSILAYIILDEKITVLKGIGAALILTGIYISSRSGAKLDMGSNQEPAVDISGSN